MRVGRQVRGTLGCGAVWLMSVVAAPAGQAPLPRAHPDPLCVVSTDAGYGVTREQAVPVGGGLTSGIERERRYLDGLRGPQGQRLRYSRIGSTLAAPDPDSGPVDMYEISYDGQAAPVTLFLDIYHLDEPRAPQGFQCGRALTSGLPPPDTFVAIAQLDALAAEIAAAPGFRAGPVELGGDPPIGLLLDAFRVRSRRVRTAAGAASAPPAATPAAAGTPAPDVQAAVMSGPRTTVVAFPQTCGTRVVSPSAIALVGARDLVVDAAMTETDLAAARARFPGQEVPAGSIAATFATDALQFQLQVRVMFADAACAATPVRESALAYTAAQIVESPMPARPADDTSGTPWVAVQAIIDHQGAFQQVRALGGPPALARLAEATVRTWKARPPRAGDAPIATPVVLQVTFTTASPR